VSVRALMLDVDGVVVRDPDARPWTADLQAELGINPARLASEFFDVHFDEVLLGRADLIERLDRVLPTLGAVSSGELVAYWFTRDSTLDEQLLADLDAARAQGLQLHLATLQEHRRASFLWQQLGLCEHFDAMHYSAALGVAKSDPTFYSTVEGRTGLTPGAHCLIDDRIENVDAARRAGWQAFLWTPSSRLRDVLRSIQR
jgi:putative hydrolase of the HAD superfamily